MPDAYLIPDVDALHRHALREASRDPAVDVHDLAVVDLVVKVIREHGIPLAEDPTLGQPYRVTLTQPGVVEVSLRNTPGGPVLRVEVAPLPSPEEPTDA